MPFLSTFTRKQHEPLFAFAQTGVINGPPSSSQQTLPQLPACEQHLPLLLTVTDAQHVPCAAAGELLAIFAAIVIWQMTETDHGP
jgi:hypothetical protein